MPMAATLSTQALVPESSDLTFTDQFARVVAKFGDRVAFRLKTPAGYRNMTYREVERQARYVASGLVALGLKPGDRAAILSENRPEWVVAYLGIFMAGGTVVPLDAQISAREWRLLIEDSEAGIIFASALLIEKLRDTYADESRPPTWICFDSSADPADSVLEFAKFHSMAETPPQRYGPGHPLSSDIASIIYTSGTTGKPKGVMLTHQNIVSEITSILQVISVNEKDSLLCLLPLQHVFASVINVLTPLWIGAQVTFADTLKRSEILEVLEQSGITVLATVPQFFYLFHERIQEELQKKPAAVRHLFAWMLRVNGFLRESLNVNLGKTLFAAVHKSFGSRLRLFVSGGSSFDLKVAREFHDLGFTILQGYGLTETTGGSTATRIEDNILGSVGKPIPGAEIRIAQPNDEGIGEILIRGPILMKGYYKNPDATDAVIRDGWLLTGDLGRVDAEGNLFITGRSKEIIVLSSGKNIYPDEIETHYLQCPFIQEIAVLGIRGKGGYENSERLHAVVVPNFDTLKAKRIANAREILRDEIGRFSNMLPKYKRLMSYEIQKEPLPRTTTRKIRRLELKKRIEANGSAGAQEPAAEPRTMGIEDRSLMETAVGQQVVATLRESRPSAAPIDPGMNLELDLGFDSMERVELLARLEQALGVDLPDDFGSAIFTVRDLILRLEQEAQNRGAGGAPGRPTWKEILSEDALSRQGDWKVRFSGWPLALLKYVGLKILYLFFRVFLRLETRGLENLPRAGPFLLCPNHLSYLDPLVLMSALPYRILLRVFFVGASEYFVSWSMKLLARLASIVPVDPDANLLKAMKVGGYGLRTGRVLCIFPEGARSFDGELKEFKKGAAILAREIGVPIVPVGIQGTYEVWARDSARIRLHKVRIEIGQPQLPGQGDYQSDTDRLRATVSDLIR